VQKAVIAFVVSVVVVLGFGSYAAAGTKEGTRKAARSFASSKISFADDTRGHHASVPTKVGKHLAYAPPAARANATTVVYLHGAHGLAEKGCPWMRSGASEVGWLVCPEAINADAGGTWSWGADVAAQGVVVEGALASARAEGASSEPGVAVGFSQGSYVALDLVKTGRAKFRGLVLLGAEMHPSPERLRDAGVSRIVLGAGAHDGAYASMKDEAQKMNVDGLDVRFVDLGNVGHTYAAENTEALRAAIAWAAGNDQ
jgi:pimeloyl-ACP methyl ester carboxylesterase